MPPNSQNSSDSRTYGSLALVLFMGVLACLVTLIAGGVSDSAVRLVLVVSSVAGTVLFVLVARKARSLRSRGR